MKKLFLLVVLLTPLLVSAQSNVQVYTPSVLLNKGQVEVILFNNYYSQTHVRNQDGEKVTVGQRQSFLRNSFGFLYGVSNSSKFNLGFELNVSSARYSSIGDPFFNIFGNSDTDFKKTLLSSFGPKVKLVPFGESNGFSVQSTFLIPVSSELEAGQFVDHDRYSWFTQFFYDKALGQNTRLFLEADVLYRIKGNAVQQNFIRFPLSAIFSYFPNSKSTVYGLIQHAPVFGNLVGTDQETFGQLRWFTQIGIGAKYQITQSVELEASYGNFLNSRKDGAGQVVNLGIRIIN
jgi:hypothetical protein